MSNHSIQITEAPKGKAYKDFLEVPYIVQGNNPVWVPPLRVQAKEMFDEKKNPFFEHAQMRRFVAYKDGRPVGRIAAIKDDAHNSTHNENTCHWGHFETIEDRDVAAALFAKVEDAGREWGFDTLRGPFNPSINEDIGILLDAYDQRPTIMMPYNPPYYPRFIDELGYDKAMDIVCFHMRSDKMSPRLARSAEALRKRSKLRFRNFNPKDFWTDAYKLWEIYKVAWEKNWGAVPMTDNEFKHLATNLKQVYDHRLIYFVEDPAKDNKLVAFSMGLPDINEAVIKIRDGRLFPFGLLKLMWHTRKGALNKGRGILMGVLEEYRGRGIDAVM
ncbi:MAG TPA: N-acetyltransferase, partial [Bacteroidetes bacterium]|nr:N-acetyltransferase [Bacteroidota bacterium]HEX05070.1 N-acetyltransferase [Bacteroidota bacterium]